MPLQLYDKEQILEACLAVFARHGYKNTSAVMLAEAAGVSKALIFHHFKSKKELYLSVLGRCIGKVRTELDIEALPEYGDFFAALDEFSYLKLDYYRKNPDECKVLKEAFYVMADELKAEIEERYGAVIAAKDKVLERLFQKLPLREGVNREQAFELIMVVLDYVEEKCLAGLTDKNDLDQRYWEGIIGEMNNFFAMIRYGIER
ncbi:TetR/AcrR family transcriptional regulator [Desulfoscipio sp. XC116]|uniref:TetR/AcrR family transcriptional regulator n=1 Tax=Desulfoscipio sp. XC116 TaxID=3144975 RepID=UPI00325AABD6